MPKRRSRLLIGEELREARLKAGLTQEALAFAAEVDRTYISYVENDRKSPTLEMLATLCSATGVRVSDLIRRAEKSSSA